MLVLGVGSNGGSKFGLGVVAEFYDRDVCVEFVIEFELGLWGGPLDQNLPLEVVSSNRASHALDMEKASISVGIVKLQFMTQIMFQSSNKEAEGFEILVTLFMRSSNCAWNFATEPHCESFDKSPSTSSYCVGPKRWRTTSRKTDTDGSKWLRIAHWNHAAARPSMWKDTIWRRVSSDASWKSKKASIWNNQSVW